MPLPPDLVTIELTGTWPSRNITGFVIIGPSETLEDPVGHATFMGSITQRVWGGVMKPVTLPCTDNVHLETADGKPVTYRVTERLGGPPLAYTISLPSTLGPMVDLSTLRPAT